MDFDLGHFIGRTCLSAKPTQPFMIYYDKRKAGNEENVKPPVAFQPEADIVTFTEELPPEADGENALIKANNSVRLIKLYQVT